MDAELDDLFLRERTGLEVVLSRFPREETEHDAAHLGEDALHQILVRESSGFDEIEPSAPPARSARVALLESLERQGGRRARASLPDARSESSEVAKTIRPSSKKSPWVTPERWKRRIPVFPSRQSCQTRSGTLTPLEATGERMRACAAGDLPVLRAWHRGKRA